MQSDVLHNIFHPFLLCFNSLSRYTNIAEVSLDIRMKSKRQVALDEGFQALETLEDLHIKFTNREII